MTYKIAVLLNGAPGAARTGAYEVQDALKAAGHDAKAYECNTQLAVNLRQDKPQVAFNGAQGKLGVEMSRLCELLGIPVIGSSAYARAVAQDASELPRALDGFYDGFDGCAAAVDGVEVSQLLFEHAGAAAIADVIAGKVAAGYPLVVRPARGFGHMGASLANNQEELLAALPAAFALDERVVIQEALAGVHMGVAVLGDAQDPYALPPVEIVAAGDDTADFFAPVRLESLSTDDSMAQAIRSEVERAAVEACSVLGLRDYSCVELVWDGARAKVLEVDASPSLGADSVFMKACEVAGISLDALLAELVEQALYHG